MAREIAQRRATTIFSHLEVTFVEELVSGLESQLKSARVLCPPRRISPPQHTGFCAVL